MTYFPTEIFTNIMEFCDDRIERNQRKLWRSIKVKAFMSSLPSGDDLQHMIYETPTQTVERIHRRRDWDFLSGSHEEGSIYEMRSYDETDDDYEEWVDEWIGHIKFKNCYNRWGAYGGFFWLKNEIL